MSRTLGLLTGGPRRPARPLDQVLADERARIVLEEAVALLPERNRRVVILRYGLDGGHERSLGEIAAVIGKCKERARQLEAEGLQLLKAMLEGLT